MACLASSLTKEDLAELKRYANTPKPQKKRKTTPDEETEATSSSSTSSSKAEEEPEAPTIPLSVVTKLSKALLSSSKHRNGGYLHEVLQGSRLVVARLPQRQSDPAVQEKLRQVRIQLENREYEKMTGRFRGTDNAYGLGCYGFDDEWGEEGTTYERRTSGCCGGRIEGPISLD